MTTSKYEAIRNAPAGTMPSSGPRFFCLGCQSTCDPAGSRGSGALKRCAPCAEKMRVLRPSYVSSNEAKMLRLLAKAGPDGILTKDLAALMGTTLATLQWTRKHARKRGIVLHSCQVFSGQGGGYSRMFVSADAMLAWKEAQKPRPEADSFDAQVQAIAQRASSPVVRSALSKRAPLEVVFGLALAGAAAGA
jgi:hypothetical protein